ncbi:FAD-dependent oxidoreductase [bacterium]|nr:FAD-dependent oxidoreductase [bacterium]
MKYDLVVFGGGTSGVASAYIAAKHGLNTLLVEKLDVLGGAITQGLVVPSMKTNTQNINTEFFNDLKTFADKYQARHTYIDGNDAWFNPELLKIVLDDMLSSVKCAVLFSSEPIDCKYDKFEDTFTCKLNHKILSLYIETKYIIDATSCGKIFQLLNCNFQNSDEKIQNPGIRFILSGIDTIKFATWLENFDTDRNVTTVEYLKDRAYLSTAYTWDTNKKWALAPLFKSAIDDNTLKHTDTAYFQLFSVAQTPDSIAFNCPRIILEEDENPNDPFVYSRALKQGRERIYRLFNFAKKYLTGFENSYISHIADVLGVRESYRVKCKTTMTKEDVLSGNKPENTALSSNYPIDIHSNKQNSDNLDFTNNNYYLPLEALISEKYDNLYAVGRIVSADFESQAALRVQLSCFSMGEAAAKDIISKN